MHILIALLLVLAGCSDGQFAGVAGKSKDDDKDDKDSASDDEAADDESDDAGDDVAGSDDADDDDTDDDGDIITSDDVATLRAKCGTADEQTKNVPLVFAATEGTACKWGQDGNLATSTGIGETRAVFGQPMKIDVPKGSVLCSIDFDGGSANVRYDDFMHFTFDGFVLASVQFTEAEFLAMGMEKTGDLIKYDRLKHIGRGPYDASMNSRTNSICPKTGSCSMVQSQTAGALSIDAPKTWFDLLPAEVLKLPEHDMTVWVTGQAHETDCQHTGMTFDLTLKYVTK